jgi:hypothetical protein
MLSRSFNSMPSSIMLEQPNVCGSQSPSALCFWEIPDQRRNNSSDTPKTADVLSF